MAGTITLKTTIELDQKVVRILGIDPGTNVLGFAVIDAGPQGIVLVEMGVLTFTKIGNQQTEKLRYIFEQVQDIIQQYHPEQMAIEAPFYGKNVQSMLKLGRAQGVAIAAGMVNLLTIEEYMPKRIKRAITGNGNASKEQVAGMLGNILKQALPTVYYDSTDALAVAVCHWNQQSSIGSNMPKKVSGGAWSAFIKNNPTRVKDKQVKYRE